MDGSIGDRDAPTAADALEVMNQEQAFQIMDGVSRSKLDGNVKTNAAASLKGLAVQKITGNGTSALFDVTIDSNGKRKCKGCC